MRLLAAKCRNNGLKVKTTSLKSNLFLARILVLSLKKFLFIKRNDVFPIKALIEEKRPIFRKLFKLWISLDIISVFIQFLLTIYLPLKAGYTVFVEEYLPATIADYVYIVRTLDLPLSTLFFSFRCMSKLMHAAPAQVVFLDADTHKLNSRWKQRKSLHERSDYLQMQRTTLLSLSKELASSEVVYVNTSNQTIKQTHETVVNHLMCIKCSAP